MAEHKRKSPAGGAKLQRTETVTIRLDPKMRYLAELASRLQRRTVSSYIEWAVDRSFSDVSFPGRDGTLADMAHTLWDVDEPDRFVHLAIDYPDLLNHEEQRRWKLIRENGYLWDGAFTSKDGKEQWTWDSSSSSSLLIERLRKHWDVFVSAARDEVGTESLPKWHRYPEPAAVTPGRKGLAKVTLGDLLESAANEGLSGKHDDFTDFSVEREDDDDLPN